jgi:hypothetical protein
MPADPHSSQAARAYEKHCEKKYVAEFPKSLSSTKGVCSGKPASHDEAKALLAALTGGFVDRLIETKVRGSLYDGRAALTRCGSLGSG